MLIRADYVLKMFVVQFARLACRGLPYEGSHDVTVGAACSLRLPLALRSCFASQRRQYFRFSLNDQTPCT